MTSNPGVSDGALYLHRCITSSNCTIDWKRVGTALDLKPGTASKRYSRLRERIDKSAAVLSNRWSGELDLDGMFLLQCIKSCACQIDFNAVGAALGLKPGTASKRYSRLLAKYKSTEDNEDDLPAAAAPKTKTHTLPSMGHPSKKRNTLLKDDSDAEQPSPAKKQKVEAQLGPKKVKQEDVEEPAGLDAAGVLGMAAIPSTDGPVELSSEDDMEEDAGTMWQAQKPRTRGRKIDFSAMFHKDSSSDENSDESSETGTDGEAQVSSEADDDEVLTDTDVESKVPVAKPGRITTIRAPGPRRAKSASQSAQDIPVGMLGAQMWQTGENVRHATSDTRPKPTMVSSPDLTQDSEEEVGDMTAGNSVGRSTPELHADHAVQLQRELEADGQLGPDDDDDDDDEDSPSEEVMQSIEVFEQKSPGFLSRLASWWK